MLMNDLKLALRNLVRRKGISFINITGLSTGLASVIVIFLYVQNELSFDSWNAKCMSIYRVIGTDASVGRPGDYARTPAPLAAALSKEFSSIAGTVRLVRTDKVLIQSGGKRLYEESVFLAEPSFFSIFTLPVLHGDQNTALNDPSSVVLTRETAKKYFGDGDPTGHTMRFDSKLDLKVTAVIEDVPANSHFHPDFLVSMSSASQIYGKDFPTNPFNTPVYTYILLRDPSDAGTLQSGIGAFGKKYYERLSFAASFAVQPLSAIHLHSDIGGELEPNGDMRYVYIISAVGLLILLMACINYMNILTAGYSDRIKEIGVRKVLGADRLALVKQFVGESTLLAAVSAVIALALVELVLPQINAAIGRRLVLNIAGNPELDAVLVGVVLATGMISAVYPALMLSSLHPSQIFRTRTVGNFSGVSVMRALIVFQFLVSTGLIISTAIIAEQLGYIRNRKLGFDRDNVIVIPLKEDQTRRHCGTLKNALMGNNRIASASASSVLPGDVEYYTSVAWKGSGWNKTMDYMYVDYDFIVTYKIELAEGRAFSKSIAGDLEGAYILNQAAARQIGWKEAIGEEFRASALRQGRVIGVMKDFNYKSLRSKIEPLFIAVNPDQSNYLSVRITPGDIPSALDGIRREWIGIFPESPFEYFFLDNHLERLYRSEQRVGVMFDLFSGLAITISCLGLVGLAMINAAKKRKEIVIRRVLGASKISIVRLISGDFVLLVAGANLIAWPLAWYAMSAWLQAFAYRIDLAVWPFLNVSALVLAAAMSVVSVQAMRAAALSPAEALRYE